MYNSIITHNDFDGVVSAAICSYVFKINFIKFAGPSTITNAQITITTNDIVCDLPYPLECGLWFDHHAGNLQELQYRNIDPAEIEGKFELQPSCARVVFAYFKDDHNLPDYFEQLVAEADIIDAFDYKSIEDWRSETPGKIIDATTKIKFESPREKNAYLKQLVYWLRDNSLSDVVQFAEVVEKYQLFRDEENNILKIIENSASFLPEDVNQELVVIDLTSYKHRPHIIKNLAYLKFKESLAVVEVQSLFNRGIKSNNLSFSMSLSLNLSKQEHNKDVGEIMRALNIGDGHAGAAAGTVYCSSKNEMLKQKENILKQIFKIWEGQQ